MRRAKFEVKMQRILVIVGILGATGCSSLSPVGGGADQPRSTGPAEAAVLFHLMERYPPGDRIVCLRRRIVAGDSIVAVDSDTRFLEQLRSAGYDAAPGSECRLRDFAGPMLHVPTGRRAVLYETTLLRRLGNRIEVNGAYYAASLDGAGCKYVVTSSGGTYSVTKESDCVVS